MAFETAYDFLSQRGYADRVQTFSVSSATVELAAKALGRRQQRGEADPGGIGAAHRCRLGGGLRSRSRDGRKWKIALTLGKRLV